MKIWKKNQATFGTPKLEDAEAIMTKMQEEDVPAWYFVHEYDRGGEKGGGSAFGLHALRGRRGSYNFRG